MTTTTGWSLYVDFGIRTQLSICRPWRWCNLFLIICYSLSNLHISRRNRRDAPSLLDSRHLATYRCRVPCGRPECDPTEENRIEGTFEVGGRELYITCAGSGGPIVLFEAGQDKSGSAMLLLQNELAKDYLACVYDRAGNRAPTPRTAADVVADLHALLTAAGVPGPYVLVGQSAGGVFVQLYARTYPAEVVGVVAMNPVPPVGPWMEQTISHMTELERAEEEDYNRGGCCTEEPFDWYASFAQLDSAPVPPDVPFEVLISTIAQCDRLDDICGRTYGVYEAVMRDVASSWPRGRFSQVKAGHATWGDAFDETIAVIRLALLASDAPSTPPA